MNVKREILVKVKCLIEEALDPELTNAQESIDCMYEALDALQDILD